jgi:hypothetical protein
MRILARGEGPQAGLPPQPGGRRVTGAGAGFLLIGAGAVLALAVPGHPLSAVNLHITGVIVIVVGVLRLLLLPAERGTGRSGGLARLVNPSGFDDPRVHDAQTAAAMDVANIREDESPAGPPGPGSGRGELGGSSGRPRP